MTDKVTHGHATKHKPNCSGGSTPCGWACIAKGKRCVDSLTGDAKALAERLIADITAPEDRSRLIVKITGEEVRALVDNSEFLSKATVAEVQARAFSFGKDDLGGNYVPPTQAIVDSISDGLPHAIRSRIKQKGKLVAGQYWDPSSETGNGLVNVDRAKLLIEMYIKQNARCAYTGLPITLLGCDLEHIVPMSAIGLLAERPDNFVLVRRAVNARKSNLALKPWVESVKVNAEDIIAKSESTAPPKIDRSALRELSVQTAPNAWTDQAVKDFGKKFYYLNPAMGLRSTISSRSSDPTKRSVSVRPSIRDGMPITLAMAKALREGNTEAADKILAADKDIGGMLERHFGGETTKAELQVQLSKYKGLIY